MELITEGYLLSQFYTFSVNQLASKRKYDSLKESCTHFAQHRLLSVHLVRSTSHPV